MDTSSLAVVGVAICAGIPVDGASAMGAGNVVMTSRYLQAVYTLARAESARVGDSIEALEGEAAKIAPGCPSSLAQPPEGKQVGELGAETSAVAFLAGAKPDAEAIHKFAARIAGLHWSNGRITALVRSLAAEERAAAALRLPDVCADIKAWTASGYHTLPESTTRFAKQVEAIGGGSSGGKGKRESLEATILRLLGPPESSRERRVVRRIGRLERRPSSR